MNLDKWTPVKDEIVRTKTELEENIKYLIDECGEYEKAEELKKMLKIINESKDEKEIKKACQDYYLEFYDVVPDGCMEYCYGKEFADFIRKVLGVEDNE
jgi:hypothetical protein